MQRKGTLTKTARELRPVAYGKMDTPMTTLKRFKDRVYTVYAPEGVLLPCLRLRVSQ